MPKRIIVDIVKYLYKPYVISGKRLVTHYFYFHSLKYGVRALEEEKMTTKRR